jgi:NDP-sugar pyrophosphorylase family protein
MHHINYGLGAFHRSVFATIPAGEKRDLAIIYEDLLKAGNLAAYEVHERFYEVGSSEGLRETSELVSDETGADPVRLRLASHRVLLTPSRLTDLLAVLF